MNVSSFRPLLIAMTIALTLIIGPGAAEAFPGMSTIHACINLTTLAGRTCTFQSDCPRNTVCHRTKCIPADEVPQDDWADSEDFLRGQPSEPSEASSSTQTAAHLDDGGADAACGTDRRCRIERLKTRNKHRRHLQIAQEERAVYAETNRLLAQQKSDIPRIDKPWIVGFQVHPTGFGAIAGHTFAAHFRAELTLVYRNQYVYFTPDDPQIPTVEGRHTATFGAGHFTYLPSSSWFSPFISAGFAMGSGEFGNFGRRGLGGTSGSSSSPKLTYHMVTAAIGAEAQFEAGFLLRLAYRHGRLVHNQASYGAGVYDVGARNGLREFMNSEGAMGFDFSIGWAF